MKVIYQQFIFVEQTWERFHKKYLRNVKNMKNVPHKGGHIEISQRRPHRNLSKEYRNSFARVTQPF